MVKGQLHSKKEEYSADEIQSLFRKIKRVTALIDEGLDKPGDKGKQVRLFQELMFVGYSKSSIERAMRPDPKRRY